ncbi:flagellar basal body rod protein FlgB [Rhodoblastus acidophilus]|uniref:Flagellar basal body rod protein FlgB n=1 Tax=Candidatus Rhodoblastus alkanivorans TaxID=2954117 RepID=A0ABS9Z3G0_9HYPH|nr:flagellar basal body rod protein FlgB [Candidatus Rhodoblastus alkanivorans]MCI4678820.1 flagellar basal body rod protein FlgB [Candidatus Rhodoblastus alkanivorans]MCI4682209.1 flagellar basal body rod protein FlgB [Candidatus Rhodoblastus alkanivorans]MDI4639511.1 flagellar basal body rod protein FlgB [Rhodoblastus acidophilus]
MQTLALFSLATQQANWLDARQATIASNVANANTPDYEARDLAPFAAVLSHMQLSMAATEPGHIQPVADAGQRVKVKRDDAWDVVYSGNSVNLEQEMMKAGEVSRAHSLNVNIIRSFQQMLMNAVKV